MTHCARVREALSARIDGEQPGLDEPSITTHLERCGACRAFEARLAATGRSLRVSPAPEVPDLTAPILQAITADAHPRGEAHDGFLRVVLAVIGVLQLALSIPALVLGDDASLPVHTARHLGSFGVALAVGFLYVAWKPSRISGLLAVMTALVACLVATSVADIVAGNTPALTESQHLAEVVGVATMWLLAHPTSLRGRPIVMP
jgi:predicted anti-sigma-YlaC factor YlaD